MEINSPQEMVEVKLHDLDIALDGTQPLSYTLRAEDKLEFTANGDIFIEFNSHSPRETVTIRGAHVRWFAERERVIQEKVKK